MTFKIRNEGRNIFISGDLTIYSAMAIKEQLAELLKPSADIDIDLSEIAEIDTAGLQLMLLAKRKAGASVRFVRHSAAVLRLIDLANLAGTLGDPVIIGADNQGA